MLKNSVVRQLIKLKPIQKYYRGVATIFMLHRVGEIDSNKLPANENMKISPTFLESFIKSLLEQGYEIISLDQLYDILLAKKSVTNKVVFTFDDGYKDNLTLALPIFEKYNIPFTVYITTSFPDRRAILWWYALEDVLLNHETIKLSDGSLYQCGDLIEKQKVFLAIRDKILKLNQANLVSLLESFFSSYKVDWYAYTDKLALSWEEIITLANHDLVTIAGHTVNHYAFNQLTADQIKYEVLRANEKLESKISKKIEHFAYPFGSENEVGETEYATVKNLKLKTVTTTRRGNIHLQHAIHLYGLPRIMLTENFDLKDIALPTRRKVVVL